MGSVNAASTLSRARARSGLSRPRAGPPGRAPHSSTLAAYEAGRKAPSVATLDRIVRAAGFELGVEIGAGDQRRPDRAAARGRELVEVLELAALFPARHAARPRVPQVRLRA